MSTIFEELARRLRRTDLLLLRAVRRQRARPSMRAKGQFWGSVITDDEVDALLRAHGEIDYLTGPDGLEDAVAAARQATRNLAKRQLTWLRGDPAIAWVPSLAEPDLVPIYDAVTRAAGKIGAKSLC